MRCHFLIEWRYYIVEGPVWLVDANHALIHQNYLLNLLVNSIKVPFFHCVYNAQSASLQPQCFLLFIAIYLM